MLRADDRDAAYAGLVADLRVAAEAARLTTYARVPMSTTDAVSLVVPSRFSGPPGTANGGWVAGRLAELSGLGGGPVEVTLRHPPPLEVDLDVRPGERRLTTLGFGGAVIARGRAVELAEGVVDPVDLDTARAAMAAYAGPVRAPVPRLLRLRHRPARAATASGCAPAGCPTGRTTGWRPPGSPTRRWPAPTAYVRRGAGLGRAGLPRRLVRRPGRRGRWCSAG